MLVEAEHTPNHEGACTGFEPEVKGYLQDRAINPMEMYDGRADKQPTARV